MAGSTNNEASRTALRAVHIGALANASIMDGPLIASIRAMDLR
jgi:hypothetical protein